MNKNPIILNLLGPRYLPLKAPSKYSVVEVHSPKTEHRALSNVGRDITRIPLKLSVVLTLCFIFLYWLSKRNETLDANYFISKAANTLFKIAEKRYGEVRKFKKVQKS